MKATHTTTNSAARMTLTGLFAAMITLMTAYICHIPYGANGGYIHFGDALIYIAAVLLPRPYALAAAAIGGGLADLLTAPMWAPDTKILNTRNIIAPFLALAISATGYYLAEGILFGSFLSPLASISGSVIQSGGSAVLFFLLAGALEKTHLKTKYAL